MNFFPSPSRAPRRGQALILAVLVMLFAALLSSAFLVLIASNGRQVGRETDRLEASRNADDAIEVVKAAIKASPSPDSWDPRTDTSIIPSPNNTPQPPTPPPTKTDVNHDYYWSQLDTAMGWDEPSAGFIKYPDPRNSRQAPKFLVSSKLLGYQEQTIGDDDKSDGGDKRFMLKITIIGLSSKNPEAWSRRILYKPTNWNGSTFAYGNFVTASTYVPNAQGTPVPNAISAPVASIGALTGDTRAVTFSASDTLSGLNQQGNTLMVSDGQNEPFVGVVQSVTGATSATLRQVHAGSPVVGAGANVTAQLVGSLFETPGSIDDNGDESSPTPTPTTAEVATRPQFITGVDPTPAPFPDIKPFGDGAYYNNGLSIPLTTTFAARPPVVRSFTGGVRVVTGQNALTSVGPVTTGDINNSSQQLQLANAVSAATPVPLTTASPANNRFLSVAFTSDGTPLADTYNNEVDPQGAPRYIGPAQINFADYKAKAQSSGGYINNADDVEKFNGQALTTSQLQRLWQRKSFPVASGGNATYTGTSAAIAGGTNTTSARLCYARPGTDSYVYPMTGGSLEQKGIRGWISPWEFLPRGAQVVLKDTQIEIIQDPLSDGSNDRPDTTKAVNAVTRSFSTGVIAPPANGIIAADGNLRVSGNWTGNPLTIVSGNNIYIEGKLSSRDGGNNLLPGKIALLAKKNVILNPTQFVARPEGAVDTSVGRDAVPGMASGNTVTLDVTKFKLGDKVAVFAQGGAAFDGWRTVSGFSGTGITLDTALPATYNGTVKVKLACDPPLVLLADNTAANPDATTDFFQGHTTTGSANDPRTEEFTPATLPATATGARWAYKFAFGGDTLARNVPFSGSVGVAISQAAQKKNLAFTVQGGDDPAPATPVVTDDGARHLDSRNTANPFHLLLTPPSGTATNPVGAAQDIDLQKVDGSTDGDGNSTLKKLRDQLVTSSGAADSKTNRWRLDLPPGDPQDILAARRLTVTDINLPADSTRAANDETTIPRLRVPLTSSVLLFNDTDLNAGTPTTKALATIGSVFDYHATVVPTPTPPPNALDEDPTTTVPAFYGATPKWNISPDATADNSVTYALAGAPGTFAFTRDGAGDYNDQLSAYYLSAVRFQNVDAGKASIAATATTPKTNMSVEVDATIYAEGGSWFVIPVPATTPYDVNLGADQNIEWRRPGYAVTVNADIAQMMTPTATLDYDDEPDPDGVAVGAMQRWTDSLSYQVNDGGTVKWQTIKINAAPLPALDGSGNFAPLPQLPASTDILYIYSN